MAVEGRRVLQHALLGLEVVVAAARLPAVRVTDPSVRSGLSNQAAILWRKCIKVLVQTETILAIATAQDRSARARSNENIS